MTYDMLPIEREMWNRYAKFQPAHVEGYRLSNRTRLPLEYDEAGNYIERDPETWAIVDAGVIETLARQDARDAA